MLLIAIVLNIRSFIGLRREDAKDSKDAKDAARFALWIRGAVALLHFCLFLKFLQLFSPNNAVVIMAMWSSLANYMLLFSVKQHLSFIASNTIFLLIGPGLIVDGELDFGFSLAIRYLLICLAISWVVVKLEKSNRERYAAFKACSRSEHQMRSLIDEIPMPLFIAKAGGGGDIVFMNP